MLLITAVIGLASMIYASMYLNVEVEKGIIGFRRVRQFYILTHLFLLTIFLASSARNLLLLWIAIEATTLTTTFLISFYHRPAATEAAWKYLLINSIGLLLSFLGTLIYLAVATHWAFSPAGIPIALSTITDPGLIKIAFILVLVGYGTKIGLVPMHTWKPDAYANAPAPVVALLSTALLNVAFLGVIRFKTITDIALGSAFTRSPLLFFSLISIGAVALLVILQRNYKRLLAYSTIEHAGLMLLGLAFGGAASFIVLLHMIYHALTKAVLFFSAGTIFLQYSSSAIAKVRGALTVIPTTAIIFFLSTLAILGLPPFGLFTTEVAILTAGFNNHPYVVGIVALLLAITFLGFIRHVSGMVFSKAEPMSPAIQLPPKMSGPSIALLVLLIILSWYLPQWLVTLLKAASATF
jgi:hydrogenase-4 component F